MTKDTHDSEKKIIDDVEKFTLDAVEDMEGLVRRGASIEKTQIALSKKWKDACAYFKSCVKPSESEIKVLPYKKQQTDFLCASLLLYYFLLNEKDIVKVYMEELEKSKKFTETEFEVLKNLETCYLENESITKGIAEYNFAAAEDFIVKDPEYFSINTKLKFGISALKFLKLAAGNKKIEAIRFLNKEMRPFLEESDCKKEIRRLLLYLVRGVDPEILNEYVKKVTKVAHKDYCYIKEIPADSFLGLVFSAGTKSVPVLIEASSVFKDIDVEKLVDFELVVKLPKAIGKAFHSLFVCPVLKCVCDTDNLPVLLECGHVISQNAIAQISKSGSKQVFKCPYCPMECNFYKSRVLFLKN